jgi:hypothetical protein
MNLFISLSEENGRITKKKPFTNYLITKWPTVIIKDITDPNREFALEWEITVEKKYLSGRLSKEQNTIVFEFSDIEFGAEFAIWTYKILLNKGKVILYDECYSSVLPMNLVVTSLDIIKEFS